MLALLPDRGATGAPTGIRLRANPGARLYLRVIDSEPPLNREEMIKGTVRAMGMYHRVFHAIHEDWEANALEALRRLAPEERASVARFSRMLLALVDRCERMQDEAQAAS